MTIQIQRPELEALILERMKSGAYQNVEDALIEALKSSLPQSAEGRAASPSSETPRTGADLIAAMQASPYKEISIEPERYRLPVRDVVF